MSVPVYQIMGKGCHRQDENMSFSPRHVDNFVHKSFTSLLIYYHAFYSMVFIFVFHAVKNKAIPNN